MDIKIKLSKNRQLALCDSHFFITQNFRSFCFFFFGCCSCLFVLFCFLILKVSIIVFFLDGALEPKVQVNVSEGTVYDQ